MRFNKFITRMMVQDMFPNKFIILAEPSMVFKNQGILYNALDEIMYKFVATGPMAAVPSDFLVRYTKLRQNSVLIKIIKRVLFHKVIITKVT